CKLRILFRACNHRLPIQLHGFSEVKTHLPDHQEFGEPLHQLLILALVLLPSRNRRDRVGHLLGEARDSFLAIKASANDGLRERMISATQTMFEVPAEPVPTPEHL